MTETTVDYTRIEIQVTPNDFWGDFKSFTKETTDYLESLTVEVLQTELDRLDEAAKTALDSFMKACKDNPHEDASEEQLDALLNEYFYNHLSKTELFVKEQLPKIIKRIEDNQTRLQVEAEKDRKFREFEAKLERQGLERCSRCGGRGYFPTKFHGSCFKCGGAKYLPIEINRQK